VELWRQRVIKYFQDKELITSDFAAMMLNWRHSGFSVKACPRVYDDGARQSLSLYIIRAPVGL